jgi:uncharacterized BrkB/YihY/UPF0761 family membrane protein
LTAFLGEIYRIWIMERPSQFAASPAYYGAFASVPIALNGLTVAGILMDEMRTVDGLRSLVAATLGSEVARLLEDALTEVTEERSSGTVLSSDISALALFSAGRRVRSCSFSQR